MSSVISGNYRELRPDEIQQVADECAQAWQDPAIPARQYELAVKPELEKFRRGESVLPFDALVQCLKRIPSQPRDLGRLLDIGASGGYYWEVLSLSGFHCEYQALDYSAGFKELASELYPGIRFDVGDAQALPYEDGSFDTVLSSAVLMHVFDWPQVIREAVRVSSRYVIFHRTPVFLDKPTTFFEKDAYQVRCMEAHFNEDELLRTFESNSLSVLTTVHLFWDIYQQYGHRTYLCEKSQVEPYCSNKAV